MWHTKVKRNKVGDSVFAKLFAAAETAERVGVSKHAAAITFKGKIVAIGKCSYKTHPIMCEYGTDHHKIHLHAEIDAILKAKQVHGEEFLKSCDMYVLRIRKDGNIGNSRPCPGCQKAIDNFGFKRVYWTENE